MDGSCPSLPPNVSIADEVWPNEQTIVYMAAHNCHFIGCSLYVLIVNIEMFPSRCASWAQAALYKTGPVILSSTFWGIMHLTHLQPENAVEHDNNNGQPLIELIQPDRHIKIYANGVVEGIEDWPDGQIIKSLLLRY